MAKTKISEFSSTPANNTDIDSINIAEGCAPSGINDAIRELMAQLKDFQTGAQGDSFNGPIGTSTAAAGAFTTLSATGAITSTLATGSAPLVIASTTKVANLNVDLLDGADWASPAALGSTTPAAVSATTLSASSTVTLSGGTANGVAYLNGSKVVTSGSALTFDGSKLTVNSNSTTTAGFFQVNDGTTTQANSFGSVVRNSNDGNGRYSLGAFTLQNASGLSQYAYIGAQAITGASNYTPDMVFGLSTGASSYAEQMRLTSTGLGIGTSSPSSKLHVATTTSETGVQLTNNNATVYLGAVYSANNFANGTVAGQAILRSGVGIAFTTNSGGSIQATLDSSGNLGLGVTPTSTWATNRKVLQLGGSAGTVVAFNGTSGSGEQFYNSYFNTSSQNIYNTTTYAGKTDFNIASAGGFTWHLAPSGTAGNAITFTQAMTLNASGNLGIGVTSPSQRLDVYGNALSVRDGTFAGLIGKGSAVVSGGGTADLGITNTAGAILFATGGGFAERARIDSSGNFAIGTTSPSSYSANARNLVVSASGNSGITIASGASSEGALYFADGTTGADVARGVVYYNHTSNYLGFSTDSSERMRIDSSGNLLLGTTGGSGAWKLYAVSGATQSACLFENPATSGQTVGKFTRTASDGTAIAFSRGGSDVGTISITTTATAYNTSSDYRLKNTIAPMTGALAKVALLKPCTYKWNADGSDGQGFIAHELAEVVPQAVTGEKDAVDEEGNPKYQGIDTSFLVATVVAALQELKAEFDAYKASHP